MTRGPAGKKQVALTFDDGPDAMTLQYLDALDELGVRATFFVIGAHAAKHPDRVLEYARRGHEVCNHGYSHRPLPAMGPAQLVDELARTNDLLPPSITPRPFVRPPRGLVSPRSIARVFAAGYTTALWSLDSDDCRTRDPRVVEERVHPERVRPGEVVLLHEFQPWTLAALPVVVGRLRDAGYSFPTLGEMLGY